MLPEEALIELPVEWQESLLDEQPVRPALIAAAVTVRAVLHDVAAVHLPQAVYLPEDDVPPSCGADAVILIDALHLFWRDAEPLGKIRGEPLPERAAGRMASDDKVCRKRRERRELRQPRGCMLRWNRNTLCLGVVAEVFRGFAVVAAGVLVVALAHLIGNVLEAVVGIDVADEALTPAALRALELLLPPPRQLPGLKLITKFGVHDDNTFSDFTCLVCKRIL